jgi:hypothetical protein
LAVVVLVVHLAVLVPLEVIHLLALYSPVAVEAEVVAEAL